MSGRLLTTRQVAAEFGISPRTVLRWHRAGELPGFRLSSAVLRFDPAELDAWRQSKRDSLTIVGLRAVDDQEGAL